MTVYPFLGGPWDGDEIEYADGKSPDDYLGPEEMPVVDGKVEGLYVLSDAETGYVWAQGPWSVVSKDGGSDNLGSQGITT
jgi:hypothetical protein